MKRKIGELEGKPLILANSDDIVTKNELVVSINDSNDKIADIRRREGEDLLSILETKNTTSSDYDYVLFAFSSGTMQTNNMIVPLPSCEDKAEVYIKNLTAIPPIVIRIGLSENPSDEAVEYVKNYKKYLDTHPNFREMTARVEEEGNKTTAVFISQVTPLSNTQEDGIYKIYPDKIV